MSLGRIAALVAAAGLVLAAIILRARLSRTRLALAGAGAIALAVVGAGPVPDLPDPKRAIEDLSRALGQYTYVLVGAIAYLETAAFVGLIAPGEFTIIIGGVVAAQGEISLLPLIGLVWAASALGDTTSFFLGRRLGRDFLLRHGRRVRITPERIGQVDGYFERHGGATILVGRFIGLVRALAPFVAGSSQMRYGRFLPYSVVGTGAFSATFCLLGYVFYRSFDKVAAIAGQATLGLGIVVAAGVLGVRAYRRLRDPAQRRRLRQWLSRQAERPLLRPVIRVLAPPLAAAARPLAAFLRTVARLRLGPFGLELAVAGAVAAVGLYVTGLYVKLLTPRPRLTPADEATLEIADRLQLTAAVDVVRVFTDVGSLPVVGVLMLFGVVALSRERRWVEAAALVVAAVVIVAGVDLLKAEVDRPRPSSPLVGSEGQAFPSGHAAYSTGYVALAALFARDLPGLVTRGAAILFAVVLAASIGLSRIYLRVHYWSDVAGGWGLGVAVFGLCAVAALVVLRMRQNGPGGDQFSTEARPTTGHG